MSLNEQKKRWWRGFKDANTGEPMSPCFGPQADVLTDGYGIPRSMSGHTLETVVPANEKQLLVMNYLHAMVHDYRNTPLTMIVTGGNGTGKTLLGAAFVHCLAIEEMLDNGLRLSARYTDEASLTMRLSGFDTAGTFDLFARRLQVLVIDEFGMTQWSASDKKKIEQYLGVRYGNNLKTVVFTNRTSDELFGSGDREPLLSSQLRSRYASGYLVNMDGVDYRRHTDALRRAIESGGQSDEWLF